jgi:hypothetical protein
MSDLTLISPGPHGWIRGAQAALDDLSTAGDVADVEVRFGTARHLTERVLGFPVSGGHATRRTIRAVGRLLRHRLGPAVAAEALTWSASVAGSLDTSAIEVFLELAAEAPGTYRPWPLGDSALFEAIQLAPNPTSRKHPICDLWLATRTPVADPDGDYHRRSEAHILDDWGGELDDLASWLRETGSLDDLLETTCVAAMSPEEQRTLVESAGATAVDRLARHDDLFRMDISVIGVCLLRATRSTLSNKSCPPELRDRVRYPYDMATLELALRAGFGSFDRPRVRRMLAELDGGQLLALVAAAPAQTVEILRQLDLLSADELISGRLRHLDLEDRGICRAALGSSITRETVEFVVAVALRHPQATHLTWLLDDSERGSLPPNEARYLVDRGCSSIARAAMRHLPLELLVASDRECAARCGDPWVAACPGLPAIERPLLPSRLLRQQGDTAHPANRRIWYPAQLRDLEVATFPEAHGWQISLPSTVADIRHNAKVMRNCTASLMDDVLEGSLFLVILHDREGRRFNVAVHRECDRFVVGHVNSWANGGTEPTWIRAAFTRRLNEVDQLPSWERLDRPGRRPTPRRDFRRSRARARR